MEKAAVFHAGNAAKLRSGVAKCHIRTPKWRFTFRYCAWSLNHR